MDNLDINELPSPSEAISWSDFYKVYLRHDLSFLTINMRSIKNKFQELVAHLTGFKERISFILVTETWLSKELDIMFELPGYKSLNYYRPHGRGGGIKLFYLDHFFTQKLEQQIFNSCGRHYFKYV